MPLGNFYKHLIRVLVPLF